MMAKSGKKNTGSLASVFDVSSVLSQNHFKPFWDSIRDYFFLVMISTAVYMALSVQPGQHFHCRPLANLQNNLTTDDTTYVNAVCFTQYAKQRPIEAYAGPLSLASSLTVYVLIMLWLVSPAVVELFTTVRKADNEAEEIELNGLEKRIYNAKIKDKAEAENLNGLADNEDDQVKKVTEICEQLWSLKRKNTVLKLYIVRNTLSLVFLVISAFIPLFVWRHQDWLFDCHVNTNNYRRMTCIHLITDTIQPCLILFTFSILVQALLQLVSLAHLLLPPKVGNDGLLAKHFASYSCDISATTRYIIHLTLSGIYRDHCPSGAHTVQMERETGNTEQMAQKLKDLHSKTLDALSAKDFECYIKDHKTYFASVITLEIPKGCGCDEFNFSLQKTDSNGQSLLHHALKKKRFSGPNFKVIFHVLKRTTENYNLSEDKVVNDGMLWRTVEQFLNYEYGEDNASMKSLESLVDALKKCKNEGDFAKYVTMRSVGKFCFDSGPVTTPI